MQAQFSKKTESIFSQQQGKASSQHSVFQKYRTESLKGQKEFNQQPSLSKFGSLKQAVEHKVKSIKGQKQQIVVENFKEEKQREDSFIISHKQSKEKIFKNFKTLTIKRGKETKMTQSMIKEQLEQEEQSFPSKLEIFDEHQKIIVNDSVSNQASRKAFQNQEQELNESQNVSMRQLIPDFQKQNKEDQFQNENLCNAVETQAQKYNEMAQNSYQNIHNDVDDQSQNEKSELDQDYQNSEEDNFSYSLEIRVAHNFDWVKMEVLYYTDQYKLLYFRKALFLIFTSLKIICYQILKSTLLDIYEIIVTITNILLFLNREGEKSKEVLEYQYALCILYFLDMLVHFIGQGAKKYSQNFWNLYDLIILVLYLLFIFNHEIVPFDVSTFRLIRIPIYMGRLSTKLKIMLISIASAFKQIIENLLIGVLFTVLLALVMLFAFNGMTRYRCMHEELGIFSLLPFEKATCGFIDCETGFICSRQLDNLDTPTHFDNMMFAYFQTIRTSVINDWTISMYMLMKQFHPIVCIYFIFIIFAIDKFAFQLVIAVLKCYYRRTQQYYETNLLEQEFYEDQITLNLRELQQYGVWNQFVNNLENYKKGRLLLQEKKSQLNVFSNSDNINYVNTGENKTRLLSARQNNEIKNQRNQLKSQFSNESWINKYIFPNHQLQQRMKMVMSILEPNFVNTSLFFSFSSCDYLSIFVEPKKTQNDRFSSISDIFNPKIDNPLRKKLHQSQLYDITQCDRNQIKKSPNRQRFPLKIKEKNQHMILQKSNNGQSQQSEEAKVIYNSWHEVETNSSKPTQIFTYTGLVQSVNEKLNKSTDNAEITDVLEQKYQNQLQFDQILNIVSNHNWSGIDVLIDPGSIPQKENMSLKILSKMKMIISQLNDGWSYNFARSNKFYFKLLQFFLYKLIAHPSNQVIIDSLICINILIVAFSNFLHSDISEYSDLFINIILVIELAVKGLCIPRYFSHASNVLQSLLILLSTIEIIYQIALTESKENSYEILTYIRIVKSLFFLRVIKYNTFAQNIMVISYQTFPNYVNMSLLLFFLILNYGIVGLQIFDFPNSNYLALMHYFGNIYQAWIAVYNIATGDDWYSVVDLSTTYGNDAIAFLYTISMIFIVNYCGFGLSIVIILDGFTNYFEQAKQQLVEQNSSLDQLAIKTIEDVEQDDSINIGQKEKIDFTLHNVLSTCIKPKDNEKYNEIACQYSLFLISKQNKFRKQCYKICENIWYKGLMQVTTWGSLVNLIVFTYYDQLDLEYWNNFEVLKFICNFVILIDGIIQIVSVGAFSKYGYFQNIWAIFDFIYVTFYFVQQSVHHQAIKWILFLGYLRPLKVTSYCGFFKNERGAIFNSLRDILQILYVILLFWFIFAIFGMTIYKDKLGYCDSYLNYGVGRQNCKGQWVVYVHNFDNIIEALQTLFILSTLDGWGLPLFICINSNTADNGPIRFNNEWLTYIFFFSFTFIGALFFVQFFAGILFINYQQNKSQLLNPNLTLDQELFLKLSDKIMKETPNYAKPAKKGFRLQTKLYPLKYPYLSIYVSIIVNFLGLLMLFEESANNQYLQIQNIVHHFLTFVFILDCLVKLISYHVTRYFDDSWRQFEFCFSFLGLLDFILDIQLGWYIQYVRAARNHPYFLYLRVFSLNRCLRMILIVQLFTRIRKLLNVIYFNKMTIIRILGLFATVLSCYSYIGCELFTKITTGEFMHDQLNFTNFFYGLILLFKCVTEDAWRNIFTDSVYNSQGYGQPWYLAAIYYYSLILVAARILMTLLVSEFVQEFERFYDTNSSCLEIYIETIDKYRNLWCKYTEDSEGQQIETRYLARFLLELGEPLGAQQGDNIWDAAKQASIFQLKKDLNGSISFRNLLYEVFKQSFKEKIFKISSIEGKKIMKENDKKIKYRLYNQRQHHLRREVVSEFVDLQSNFNLLQEYLYLYMAIKAWKAFSKIFFEVAENESQTINYSESNVEVKIQGELEGEEENLQGVGQNFTQRRRYPSAEHLRRPTDVYILPYFDEVAKLSKSNFIVGTSKETKQVAYILKPTEQKQQNKLKSIAIIKKKEQFIKVNDNKQRRDAIDKPFLNRSRYLYGYHDKMVIKQFNEETADRIKSRIDVDLIPSTYNIMKMGSKYR